MGSRIQRWRKIGSGAAASGAAYSAINEEVIAVPPEVVQVANRLLLTVYVAPPKRALKWQ